MYWLVVSGGEIGIVNSLPGAPSLSSITHGSVTSWDAHLQDLTMAGVWSREKALHINIPEIKAVQLALNAFLTRVLGELVILMNDNATVVACLKKQGSIVSRVMYSLAQKIVT